MLIEFKCPHCQKLLRAGIDYAGKNAKCPNCKKEITVPEKDSAKATELKQ